MSEAKVKLSVDSRFSCEERFLVSLGPLSLTLHQEKNMPVVIITKDEWGGLRDVYENIWLFSS